MLAAGAMVYARQAGPQSPNIVLILADDLGYGDLACYGSRSNLTPNIDQMAAQGLRFTDFHSNGPMCSPTRAALLTGLYQNRFGRSFETALSAIADGDDGLPHQIHTLAEALQSAGYATGMYGKWHLGYQSPHQPTQHGFDDFRGLLSGDGDHHSHISRSGNRDWWHNDKIEMEEGYTADLITQHSIDFLERPRDRPVFLYVAHLAIHFPWQGPQESGHRIEGGSYWDLSKLGPHPPGQVGQVVKKMVESVDDSVGKILAAVGRLDGRRPTLVFFTSDNGGYLHYAGRFRGEVSDNGPLRGQKTEVWEGGHRVPAIAWWPGRIQGGRITDQTALTMDLMATFCELAGVNVAGLNQGRALDGMSLNGLLFDSQPLPERTLFWRARDNKAARRGPWKLISQEGKAMLFNLADDIGERHDVSRQRPELMRQLRNELAGWEKDVDAGL